MLLSQNPRENPFVDQLGRKVSYLRLSVTDRCDLRCTYCMAEHMKFLPRKDVLMTGVPLAVQFQS